ncbi:hypothetical protein CCACVL1_17395 [Corchorus capsularis]|uniref:Reverse transcriptase n=1 Tax=Corchorus capsularis TaxID=210143 RepID=A0A1R3HS77_COCAP|nr:hypothetical protein CCACVL1_17395 [Corchorus capsularis]
MAVGHYQRLYTESLVDRVNPNPSVTFPRIEEQNIIDLHRPVSEEEIKQTMFEIGAFKAPGPDRFQAHFFHKNWDIVGASITNQVREAFVTGSFPEELNRTLIALIPKVKHP